MLLLVIKSLNVVGNFRPKDGQHGSTGQKTVHRLPADSNTYGVRNVVLGHYCEHHTMDKSQKLSNPERNMLLSKLTRTKTEQSESKQVNFYFEIPYRKVHFDLLSRWNRLYRRNQRGTVRHASYRQKQRYCQRNWHASQYPSLSETIVFREYWHNVAVHETANIEPVISPALLQSPTPTDVYSC